DVPLCGDLLPGQVLQHAADLDLLPRQRVRPGRLDLAQPAGVEITVVEKQAGPRRRRRARPGRGGRDSEAGLRVVHERAAVVEVRVARGEPAGDEQVGSDAGVGGDVDAVEHLGPLAAHLVDERYQVVRGEPDL